MSALEEDVRRAAYALAGSKLRGLRSEIHRRASAGQKSKQIAAELGVPIRTVQDNRKAALRDAKRIEKIAKSIGDRPFGRKPLMHQFDQASARDFLRAGVRTVSEFASANGR
jgi:hypothetical protein